MIRENGDRKYSYIFALVGLILIVAGIFGGIAMVWGSTQNELKNINNVTAATQHTIKEEFAKERKTTDEQCKQIKEDGCNTANDVQDRVIVLETKLDAIEKSQQRLEMGQKEIIRALKPR